MPNLDSTNDTFAATLRGKTIIITGANSGLGVAAARRCSALGARVVLIGRDTDQIKLIAEELEAMHFFADFGSFAEVRNLAHHLLSKCPRIDALVNNAGAVLPTRQVSQDGHELTLQVNYLAPFLLTSLLQSRLNTSKARIINTASAAHKYATVNFQDMESEREYVPFRAYAASKRMNIMHARELTHRYRSRGISAASYHPGLVATSFARSSHGWLGLLYNSIVGHRALITPEQGIDTLMWLLLARPGIDWQLGGYFYKRRLRHTPAQTGDLRQLKRLWEMSQDLIG